MNEQNVLEALRTLSQQSEDMPHALQGLLGQLGADFRVFSAPRHLQGIFEKLKHADSAEEQLVHLSELCEMLSMGTQDAILTSGGNVEKHIPRLVQLIMQPIESMDVLRLASSALQLLLDASSSILIPTILKEGIISTLCERLLNIEYMDVAEFSLNIMEKIVFHSIKERNLHITQLILQENGLVAMLQFVDFFPIETQIIIARITTKLCYEYPSECLDLLPTSLPLLESLTQSYNQDIMQSGWNAFTNLLDSSSIQNCAAILTTITNTGICERSLELFRTFNTLQSSQDMYSLALYTILIRFNTILLQTRYDKSKSIKSNMEINRIMLQIFAEPKYTEDVYFYYHCLLFLQSISTNISNVASDEGAYEAADRDMAMWIKCLPMLLSNFHLVYHNAKLAKLQLELVSLFLSEKSTYLLLESNTTTSTDKSFVVVLSKFIAFIIKPQLMQFNQPKRKSKQLLRDYLHQVTYRLEILSYTLDSCNRSYRSQFYRDGIFEYVSYFANIKEQVEVTPEVQTLCAEHNVTTLAEKIVQQFNNTKQSPLVLTQLRALISECDSSISDDLEYYEEYWQKLHTVLLDSHSKTGFVITDYEVRASKIAPQLKQILSTVQGQQAFQSVVLKRKTELVFPFTNLIEVLQEGLTNDFNMLINNTSTRHSVTDVFKELKVLNNHFKIKIHFSNDVVTSVPALAKSSAHVHTSVILIEPLATVETIKKFVFKKLFQHLRNNGSQAKLNLLQQFFNQHLDLRDMDDCDVDDEAEDEEEFSEYPSEDSEASVALGSSVEKDLRTILKKLKLNIAYKGLVLQQDSTLLEVLTKYETNLINADGSTSASSIHLLWEKPHELTFQMTESSKVSNMRVDRIGVSSSLTASSSTSNGGTSSTNCNSNESEWKAMSDVMECLCSMFHVIEKLPEFQNMEQLFVNNAISNSVRNIFFHPLAVASKQFPPWFQSLQAKTILYCFLPFATKLLCTYGLQFDTARAFLHFSRTLWQSKDKVDRNHFNSSTEPDNSNITHHQNCSENLLSTIQTLTNQIVKIPRLKIRVARSAVLQSGMKLLSQYGGLKSLIEIEFLGEVGTGLGPTTEFYSLICQEIQAQGLKLWRHDPSHEQIDSSAKKPKKAAEAVKNQAMPISGYHRIGVCYCSKCHHVQFPTCSAHDTLLTCSVRSETEDYAMQQSNDNGNNENSSSNSSRTIEPLCAECNKVEDFAEENIPARQAVACPNCCSSTDNTEHTVGSEPMQYQWWILSEDENQYMQSLYPMDKSHIQHAVLQCEHCHTVNFPGTEHSLIEFTRNQMRTTSGQIMQERDYRSVMKHVSLLCEGTVLKQIPVHLSRDEVKLLRAKLTSSPEILDSELELSSVDFNMPSVIPPLVHAPNGLYPRAYIFEDNSASQEVLKCFEFLGMLVAQAIIDDRLMDLPLSSPFVRALLGEVLNASIEMGLYYLSHIDSDIAKSLQYLYDLNLSYHDSGSDSTSCVKQDIANEIESMGLSFEVIGSPNISVCSHIPKCNSQVNIENVLEFVELNLEYLLGKTIQSQVKAFQDGFSHISGTTFSSHYFTVSEWVNILQDTNTNLWDTEGHELKQHIICAHGYSSTSQTIADLIDILCHFTPHEQRQFVRFVTGSTRLPLGGLSNLEPKLTIVRKYNTNANSIDSAERVVKNTMDDILPSASTCTNYLKLPEYSSKRVLHEKLLYCINEGQFSFHLS